MLRYCATAKEEEKEKNLSNSFSKAKTFVRFLLARARYIPLLSLCHGIINGENQIIYELVACDTVFYWKSDDLNGQNE